MKLISIPLLFVAAVANTALANERMLPAFEIQIGANAQEFKLGLGSWDDAKTNHGQFYISHFNSEDTNAVEGNSVGKREYTSTRLGLNVLGFSLEPNKAVEGGFFLYSNKSEFNIDRAGVGINFALGKMLNEKIRIHAGASLMPEFLSTDWDAEAVLEYELNTGITYRINDLIDISAEYRHGATFDDISIKHYGQLMGGFAIRM